MAETSKLRASLTASKPFTIGGNPQPANTITLLIENLGGPVVSPSEEARHLKLKGYLGTNEEALFEKEEDAKSCTKGIPNGWNAKWEFFADGARDAFQLNIWASKDALFDKGSSLKIGLASVKSRTAPGTAVLTFETQFGPVQSLSVQKDGGKPDIVSFSSNPPEDVQNFPGDPVTLKWRTHKLIDRELTQVGIPDPLPCKFDTDEGQHKISATADAHFRLRGYDGNRPIDRILAIRVLRNDWYDVRNEIHEGNSAMPDSMDKDAIKAAANGFVLEPTLLLNASNTSLYGIFRHEFQGRERALLFKTENPFGEWQHVMSSIPEGASCSPGVYFDKQIWLIGGSQIDPANVSKDVWCGSFQPDGRRDKVVWKKLGDAPWSQRMGHAVVVFDGRIWMMGGRDKVGNELNDVWVLDASGKWSRDVKPVPWDARCLFSLVDHQEKIWLYGGAKAPFVNDKGLYNDLWTYSVTGGWERQDITGIIKGQEGRMPIASCLQVFRAQLCLFGKFRMIVDSDKSGMVESLAFSLSDLNAKLWSRFSSDRLQHWWDDAATFNYQLVNFRDRMLIARGWGRKNLNAIMQVYVALQ